MKEINQELGASYLRLEINANDDFKYALEKYLLYKGKIYANEYYHKEYVANKFYFSIEIEDGSLISRLKIYGKIALVALAAYGGARAGIDYLIRDSQTITERIVQDMVDDNIIDPNTIIRVERRLGVPGQIKRLYKDIENLGNNRQNLTPVQQQELIDRILRRYENLVLELDQPEINFIEQEIRVLNIPIPIPNRDGLIYYPPQFAIREDEPRIISEDEIEEVKQLPMKNK